MIAHAVSTSTIWEDCVNTLTAESWIFSSGAKTPGFGKQNAAEARLLGKIAAEGGRIREPESSPRTATASPAQSCRATAAC
jgi:hypothetical protein